MIIYTIDEFGEEVSEVRYSDVVIPATSVKSVGADSFYITALSLLPEPSEATLVKLSSSETWGEEFTHKNDKSLNTQ